MIIKELWERNPKQYQDVAQDNSQPRFGQLRKTRLTLKQLNKLRQMNDLRTYEFAEKMKKVKEMYAPPPAAPMA
jgi:hypothetical protein